MACDRCGASQGGGDIELGRANDPRRLALCSHCIGEIALFAASDPAALQLFERLARQGLGSVWKRGEQSFFLREASMGFDAPR